MGRGCFSVWLLGSLLALSGCHDPSDFNGTPEDMLQAHVTKSVLLYDAALGGDCYNRKVVKTTPMTTTRGIQPSVERWTVDQCGTKVDYRVNYTPDGLGGYNYDIHQESSAPVS